LKREREAEGDEFADKEMFVTSAYKKHQQELEEQAKQDEKNGKFLCVYMYGQLLGARPQTPWVGFADFWEKQTLVKQNMFLLRLSGIVGFWKASRPR
jgi:hypothetical protein